MAACILLFLNQSKERHSSRPLISESVLVLTLRGIRWNLEDRLKPCIWNRSRLQAEVRSDRTLMFYLVLAESSSYTRTFCRTCKVIFLSNFFTEDLEICEQSCSPVYKEPRCKEWMKRSCQLHLHRVLLWETLIWINSPLLQHGSHTTTSEGPQSWQICGVCCNTAWDPEQLQVVS